MSTRKVQKFDAFKMTAYYFLAICIILKIFKTWNGERGTGNGERGTGNGERGTGNREWERGTGNGERGIFKSGNL